MNSRIFVRIYCPFIQVVLRGSSSSGLFTPPPTASAFWLCMFLFCFILLRSWTANDMCWASPPTIWDYGISPLASLRFLGSQFTQVQQSKTYLTFCFLELHLIKHSTLMYCFNLAAVNWECWVFCSLGVWFALGLIFKTLAKPLWPSQFLHTGPTQIQGLGKHFFPSSECLQYTVLSVWSCLCIIIVLHQFIKDTALGDQNICVFRVCIVNRHFCIHHEWWSLLGRYFFLHESECIFRKCSLSEVILAIQWSTFNCTWPKKEDSLKNTKSAR